MIHLFALLSLLLCGVCYTGFQNSSHFRNTGSRRSLLLLVFGGALLLRLLLAYTTTASVMISPVLQPGLTGSSL